MRKWTNADRKRTMEFLDPRKWINPQDAEPLSSLHAEHDIFDFSEPFEEIYEERIVAFIDLLGFRMKIEGSHGGAEAFISAYDSAAGMLDTWTAFQEILSGSHIPGDIRLTVFSDSAVLSIYPQLESLVILLTALNAFLATPNGQAAMRMSRGGIAKGQIYHSNRLVFGPAMLRAYDLESKVAIAPRYVFDEALVAEIQGSVNAGPYMSSLASLIRRDFDGKAFLHLDSSDGHDAPSFRDEHGKYLPEAVLAKLRWIYMRSAYPSEPALARPR